MNKGNLEKWKNITSCNNMLLFAQLCQEQLFDYSIPSHRISTLNSHYLCLDALSAIESIENNGVPEGTLRPIMEELYVEIKKDPVFSSTDNPIDYFAKYQNGKYEICHSIADMGYEALKNSVNAIHDGFFTGNKYYLQLKERIVGAIRGNKTCDQKILVKLTKSLLTELMNKGYSLRYLYMVLNKLFWAPQEDITSNDIIDSFFDSFSFQESSYDVVIKVQKGGIKPLISQSQKIECFDVLPTKHHSIMRKEAAFVKKESTETFLIISWKALDPYSAAEDVQRYLKIEKSLYRLYDHGYNYSILDSDCMICDDNKYYKMGKTLKAVEHTKKPSSKDISVSMQLAIVAFQSGAKNGNYDDVVTILNAIRYHSHSLDSLSEENQLLDLWAIFESVLDISNHHTSDRIQQVCMYLVPLLKQRYLYSLFRQLADDVKTYNEVLYRGIVADESNETEIVRRVSEFVLLPENEADREKALKSFYDFPLLAERIRYYNEVLCSPMGIHSFVEKHAERVRWQIMRIYRNRNLVIHNGNSMPYLSLLIENLHSYVDDFLTYTIHGLSRKKSIHLMCQELFVKECKWNASFPRQKGNITKEQIKYILSL